MEKAFPIHRLTEFPGLIEADIAALRGIGGAPEPVARGATIRNEGSRDRAVFLLVDGWVSSSLLLRDGQRQIVKLHLPGDMLGATSMCVDHAVDTIVALTPAVVKRISLVDLGALMQASPRIAHFMLLSAQKERIALMDRLAWVARAAASTRMATFLLELNHRLTAIGQSDGRQFEIRLTQEQVGDHLGLTGVHVNRVLRALEREGTIARRGRRITIADPAVLANAAALPLREASCDMDWLGGS